MQVLTARSAPLAGSARVQRALPRRELRRLGPFVFCDHFGPVPGEPGAMDVPPHPHVGLQTVTYLFSGAIEHTDSLGSRQIIRPGDVNWMTAGRGIVHAERVAGSEPLHGLQTWVGLPHAHRKTAPAFSHVPRAALPLNVLEGAEVRVIAGRLGGEASPVPTFQAVTFFDVTLEPGAVVSLPVDPGHALGLYVAVGVVEVAGVPVPEATLAELEPGRPALPLAAPAGARLAVLGGEPLPEPTVTYWNFVVDSVDEGRAREADWEAGRFDPIPA